MNNSEYSAYLECQLTGCYDREIDITPMADDPQSFEGSDEEITEPDYLEALRDEACPVCGSHTYIALGSLGIRGNHIYRRCRACGCDYSLEVE
jgi:hypothetical protein